jgi:hypothetical protein
MLAEKFFLVLETIRSHAADDESFRERRAAQSDQVAAPNAALEAAAESPSVTTKAE